jgi:hypothetical protein
MRNSVMFVGLGVALVVGTSAARAQTVEAIATPAVAVPAPVETVETVRTVTTTEPRRAHGHVVHPRIFDRVTTITRTTTVRPGMVAAGPAYDEPIRGRRLYDMVTPTPAVAPAVAAQPAVPAAAPGFAATPPVVMPTYRYVYQPDRILVIDPYTNIAVQAIPR